MSPLKSQAMGIALAAVTGVGCIAYERLVKTCSFPFIQICLGASFIFSALASIPFMWPADGRIIPPTIEWRPILVYVLAGLTSPIWYAITREQGVMVGASYELKYIVVLGVLYVLLGSRPLSASLLIGVVLAMASVYFVSRG